VPKWTVGNGGSGGATQQLLITEIYPGLLDGCSVAFIPGFDDAHVRCGLFPELLEQVGLCGMDRRQEDSGRGYTKDLRGVGEDFLCRSTLPPMRAAARSRRE